MYKNKLNTLIDIRLRCKKGIESFLRALDNSEIRMKNSCDRNRN